MIRFAWKADIMLKIVGLMNLYVVSDKHSMERTIQMQFRKQKQLQTSSMETERTNNNNNNNINTFDVGLCLDSKRLILTCSLDVIKDTSKLHIVISV